LPLLYSYLLGLTLPPAALRPSTSTTIDDLWAQKGTLFSAWLSGGTAPSTNRQYNSQVKEWYAFSLKYGLSDRDLFTRESYTTSLRALSLFVYEMKIIEKRSSGCIKRTLQALRHELVKNSYDISVFSDPTLLLARKATREPARVLHKARRARQRLPVTFDILFWLRDYLQSTNDIDDLMTYCGTLLSYNFMLRCSEYCHTPDAPHAVLCEDVSFITYSGATLTPADIGRLALSSAAEISDIIIDLCSSKADRDGKGRRLTISRANGPTDRNFIDTLYTFTVRAAHKFPDDPFLSRYRGHRRKKLHRGMVNNALKFAARHFGIDELYFSTHSLRIGGATAGAAGGRSRSSLCRLGGWSELSASDALYRHTTPQDRGILSLVDEGSHLLSTRDLRSMVPSLHRRPRL
jgi:hypothetical protein